MSRNVGHVVFQKDNSISYLIYNGSVERCYPELYGSFDEAAEAFREGTFGVEWPLCTCGNAEPVIIVPYDAVPVKPDSTIHWEGMACRRCRCIHSGLWDPRQRVDEE